MELKLNGESLDEEMTECEYAEYAAARCDSLQLRISDKNGDIRGMNIKKGDTVEIKTEEAASGIMYISELEFKKNTVFLRALSTNLACFREKSFYRNTISFCEMIKEIERETGYKLKLINTLESTYIDVTRIQKNPISYLTERLRLEGYQIKINNNTMIIYDEKQQEKKEPAGDYSEEDFTKGITYSTKDSNIIESIKNTYRGDGYTISSQVESGLTGRNINTSIAVTSIAESERLSRGIMREANKYEFLSAGWIDGTQRKAGQSINVECNLTDFKGKNYIYQIKHDFIREKQKLYMRKPIVGEY